MGSSSHAGGRTPGDSALVSRAPRQNRRIILIVLSPAFTNLQKVRLDCQYLESFWFDLRILRG